MVGMPRACHHPSSGGAFASARVGIGQRRALQSGALFCYLLGHQVIYELPVGGQSCIHIHQQIHDSHEIRLILSPVMLGGNSGGGCFLLSVCLSLFVEVSGAADFFNLDLGAMVVSKMRRKAYQRSDLIHLKMLSGDNFEVRCIKIMKHMPWPAELLRLCCDMQNKSCD